MITFGGDGNHVQIARIRAMDPSQKTGCFLVLLLLLRWSQVVYRPEWEQLSIRFCQLFVMLHPQVKEPF